MKAQSDSRYWTQYSRAGCSPWTLSLKSVPVDGELLEDAAVVPVLQAPEAGHERGAVDGEPFAGVSVLEAADDAVHEAGVFVPVNGQERCLADDVGCRDRAVLADQPELELVELRERLLPVEAGHPQGLREPINLESESVRHWLLPRE
jgi:hypothetical protein